MIEKLDRLLVEYANKFGEGFPTYQIARMKTTAEVIGIIEECLNSGKDAYELGYVTDDLDVKY